MPANARRNITLSAPMVHFPPGWSSGELIIGAFLKFAFSFQVNLTWLQGIARVNSLVTLQGHAIGHAVGVLVLVNVPARRVHALSLLLGNDSLGHGAASGPPSPFRRLPYDASCECHENNEPEKSYVAPWRWHGTAGAD
mmetsp:Transcript_32301/g.86521  ORF Transcript_32301/g.86521 Transcript_32301/m.86521 type:complete len:139 (+) Transcript_32301:240-656(+)